MVKETPVPSPTPAVCATEAAVAELKTAVQTTPTSEKEKEAVPPTAFPTEVAIETENAPIETPAVYQVQPTPESEATSEPAPEPVPDSTPEPPANQPTQSGDVIYVEGFGWIESQGPNRVEYAADMYENGNKIGIMG